MTSAPTAAARAAPRHHIAAALTQIRHLVEAFRMTRHQHQQGLRQTPLHHIEGAQDQFFLAGMGAGGDPYRPFLAPFPAQLLGAGAQVRGQLDIELDIAGDMHMLGIHAQGDKAVRIGTRLGGQLGDIAQGGPGQSAYPTIALRRRRRQPRIGENQRNPRGAAAVKQVGPDLGLHDDDRAGPHPPEKTPHRTGQIIGRIDMKDLVRQLLPHPLRTGHGSGSHQHRHLPVLPQPGDQRQGRLHLAHGHRMHPHRPRHRQARKKTETLPPAAPISRRPAAAPQQSQDDEGHQQIEQ